MADKMNGEREQTDWYDGITEKHFDRAVAKAVNRARASLAANAGGEPVAGVNEYGVRGYLAATLKCWHRLTGDEAAELVAMTQRLSGLYTHPSPPEGAWAEQALLKVPSVVQRYLPPDGPTAQDAMSEITAIVDPWPLGRKEKP